MVSASNSVSELREASVKSGALRHLSYRRLMCHCDVICVLAGVILNSIFLDGNVLNFVFLMN